MHRGYWKKRESDGTEGGKEGTDVCGTSPRPERVRGQKNQRTGKARAIQDTERRSEDGNKVKFIIFGIRTDFIPV